MPMADFFKLYGAYICLGIPSLFYMGQAVFYASSQGRIGMMIAFVSYTVANIGLILDAKGI